MNTPLILLVDDEGETRNTLRAFLGDRVECSILEAENGEQALEVLREKRVDLMILDVRMPKKSGFHVLEEMGAIEHDPAKKTDTIVITAWDSEMVAGECAKRNVDCIPKPYSLVELYEKIKRILSERQQFHPRNIS